MRQVHVHGVPVVAIGREQLAETSRGYVITLGVLDDHAFLVEQATITDGVKVALSSLDVKAEHADGRDFDSSGGLDASGEHVAGSEHESKRHELLLAYDRAASLFRNDETRLGSYTLLLGSDVDVLSAQDGVRLAVRDALHDADEVVAYNRRKVRIVLDDGDFSRAGDAMEDYLTVARIGRRSGSALVGRDTAKAVSNAVGDSSIRCSLLLRRLDTHRLA